MKREGNYSLIFEMPHNLGYTPARWFVDESLNTKDDYKRYAPLSAVLGSMSEWQQFHTYSYYAEHYGVFPVVEYATFRIQLATDKDIQVTELPSIKKTAEETVEADAALTFIASIDIIIAAGIVEFLSIRLDDNIIVRLFSIVYLRPFDIENTGGWNIFQE